jgi:CheY-like chemotaxis protein
VLVVDDNTDAADSLAALLSLQGHQTRVAHDGASALALAQREPPDVVFLDLGMSGMDGYEVARRLRSHEATRDILLVALTGWGQEQDRRRTVGAGFDRHFVKPIAPDCLHDLLADLR